jgi:hypothetical protein
MAAPAAKPAMSLAALVMAGAALPEADVAVLVLLPVLVPVEVVEAPVEVVVTVEVDPVVLALEVELEPEALPVATTLPPRTVVGSGMVFEAVAALAAYWLNGSWLQQLELYLGRANSRRRVDNG